MFHVILYQPEIPPNTGNIIRLCANANCKLHLIEPLGFTLNQKQLKRAGLDYAQDVSINKYVNYQQCLEQNNFNNIWLCSTKAKTIYSKACCQVNDAFVFGPETRGLPAEILDNHPTEYKLTIPMQQGSRSLNLANSVSVIIYEAWRQHDFK